MKGQHNPHHNSFFLEAFSQLVAEILIVEVLFSYKVQRWDNYPKLYFTAGKRLKYRTHLLKTLKGHSLLWTGAQHAMQLPLVNRS